MSSVSGSKGSGQDEVVRRNREDYQKKENELIKKHHKEVRRLNELHMQEVEKMKDSNNKNTQKIQKHASNVMTKRDQKHRKQMDELRNLHQQRLAKLKEDFQGKYTAQKESSEATKNLLKQIHEEKLNQTKNQYEKLIDSKDTAYKVQLDTARESQAKAISKNKEYLGDKHRKEFETLNKVKNRRISNLQREYGQYRENADAKLEAEKLANLRTRQRTSESATTEIQNEREKHDTQMSTLRLGFQDGLEKIRDEYETAFKEDRDRGEGARKQLKEKVEGSHHEKVRSLEHDLFREKNANVVERLELKRESEREKGALLNQFKKNLDVYEDNRVKNLDEMKKQSQEDLNHLQSRNDEIIRDTTRFMQGQRQKDNLINRKALSQLKFETEFKTEQKDSQTDKRVNMILGDAEAKIQKMREMFENSLDVMKDEYSKEKQDLVQKMETDKAQALQNLRKMVKETELKAEQKETALKAKYARTIGSMHEQNIREKRLDDRKEKILLENVARSNKEALEKQQLQFEEKVDRINKTHEAEIQRMRARHQAQMNNVLSTIKKS